MPYRKIALLAGAVALIVAVLYAGSSLVSSNRGEPQGSATTTAGGPGYTIELIDQPSFAELMPSLDRGVRFGPTIPEDVRTLITTRVQKTVSELETDPTQPGDWLDLGIWYHMANDFEGAEEVWEFLIAVAPQDTTAYDNLGRLYHYDLKDYPKSEYYFLESLRIKPSVVASYVELFQLYSLSYKREGSAAVDVMRRAQTQFPTDPGLYYMLGVYYRDRGETEKAKAELVKALELARAADSIDLIKQLNEEIAKLPDVKPSE